MRMSEMCRYIGVRRVGEQICKSRECDVRRTVRCVLARARGSGVWAKAKANFFLRRGDAEFTAFDGSAAHATNMRSAALLLLLNAPHASTNIPDGRRLGVGGPIVSWSGANAGYWREANNWNGGAPEQASRVIVDADGNTVTIQTTASTTASEVCARETLETRLSTRTNNKTLSPRTHSLSSRTTRSSPSRALYASAAAARPRPPTPRAQHRRTAPPPRVAAPASSLGLGAPAFGAPPACGPADARPTPTRSRLAATARCL